MLSCLLVCAMQTCYANRNTQLQMLWRSRAFAKFFDCMTWLAKMDLILIFTLSKGSNGLVLNLASWESMRCVGIFVVLIIWILFVGSKSCKLGINETCRHLCCTYYLDLICWFWILQAGKHGMMMQYNNHNKQFKLGSIIFVKVRQMCWSCASWE